jgi:oligopeptide transport system permease protein
MSDNRPGDDARRGPTIDDTVDTSSIIPGDEQLLAATTAGGVSARSASLTADAWRELRRSPLFIVSTALILIMVLMAAFPQLFTRQDPRVCDLANSRKGPEPGHWFGFDIQGCDYYSNVVYGARPSIVIGITVTAISAIIAIVLGSLSGYYGGTIDTIFSRLTDIFFGIPFILGAIVLLNTFPVRSIWTVCAALIVFGWMVLSRLMRSSVISARDMDYVNAARALGAPDGRIIRRHILPNAITPLVVYSTVTIGTTIAAEATLSFLGVGLQLPAISWGLQIAQAQTLFQQSPHLLLFPAAFLSVTVLSFILLGDAVRDAFDPKLR